MLHAVALIYHDKSGSHCITLEDDLFSHVCRSFPDLLTYRINLNVIYQVVVKNNTPDMFSFTIWNLFTHSYVTCNTPLNSYEKAWIHQWNIEPGSGRAVSEVLIAHRKKTGQEERERLLPETQTANELRLDTTAVWLSFAQVVVTNEINEVHHERDLTALCFRDTPYMYGWQQCRLHRVNSHVFSSEVRRSSPELCMEPTQSTLQPWGRLACVSVINTKVL